MGLITITTKARANLSPSAIGYKNLSIGSGSSHIFTISNLTIETTPSYLDPEGDEVEEFKLNTRPSSGSVKLNGSIMNSGDTATKLEVESGLLAYVSDPLNENEHQDSFEFDLSDQGSSEFSGLDTGVVNILIAKLENLPPNSVGDYSQDISYGENLTITRAMLTTIPTPAYSDPEGDKESMIKILSVPESGLLRFNGDSVYINQEISFDDIDLGLLIYSPDLSIVVENSLEFSVAISDVGSNQFTI